MTAALKKLEKMIKDYLEILKEIESIQYDEENEQDNEEK